MKRRLHCGKKPTTCVLLALLAISLTMLARTALVTEQQRVAGFLLVLVGGGALTVALIELVLYMQNGMSGVRTTEPSETLIHRNNDGRYHDLFHMAPIAMALTTQEGKVLACNAALLDLFGCCRSESSRINLAEACRYPQDWARLVELLGKQGCVRDFETRLVPRKGSPLQVSLTATRFRLNGSNALLTVCQDITERKHAEEALLIAQQEMKILALLDGLTGIANRHLFDNRLRTEWKRAARNHSSLSLILADIDSFKAYNDTQGHLAGDRCLKRVAEALRNRLKRPCDLIARYGGEEFTALLPDTAAPGALRLAESMQAGIQELRIAHPGPMADKQLSLSFGIAAMVPRPHLSPDVLIEAADRALYEAKNSGKNCIRISNADGTLGPDPLFRRFWTPTGTSVTPPLAARMEK